MNFNSHFKDIEASEKDSKVWDCNVISIQKCKKYKLNASFVILKVRFLRFLSLNFDGTSPFAVYTRYFYFAYITQASSYLCFKNKFINVRMSVIFLARLAVYMFILPKLLV